MDETQLTELEGKLRQIYGLCDFYHELAQTWHTTEELRKLDGYNIRRIIHDIEKRAGKKESENTQQILPFLSKIQHMGLQSFDMVKDGLTGLINEQREEVSQLCKYVQEQYNVNGQNLLMLPVYLPLVGDYRPRHHSIVYLYCPDVECVRVISEALTNGTEHGPFDIKCVDGYQSGKEIGFSYPMDDLGLCRMGSIDAENQPMLLEALLRVIKYPEYREKIMREEKPIIFS